jgi:ABC-type dipeptide/oligopeptide/nickel transport system permease subunit
MLERAISVDPPKPDAELLKTSRAFSEAQLWLAIFKKYPLFAVGYGIVGLVVAVAVLAPWLTPYDPMRADASVYLQPPDPQHWLGTDNTGFMF